METRGQARTLVLFALGLLLAAGAAAYLPVNAPNFDVDNCGSLLQPKHDEPIAAADTPDELALIRECQGELGTRRWMAAAAAVPGVGTLGLAAAIRSRRSEE